VLNYRAIQRFGARLMSRGCGDAATRPQLSLRTLVAVPRLTRVLLTVAALVATLALDASAQARTVKLGSTAVVRRVSGTVKYKPLGASRYKTLATRATIKMGSSVDATHGTVKLITASNAKGATQSGKFYDGAFVVTQARQAKAVTELKLIKGDFTQCQQAAAARAHSAASGRSVRKLWGRAKGRFKTKGRYSAASVRGTVWLTEDFCDASRVTSKEGAVEDTSAAPSGPSYVLQPGQFVDTFCNAGQPVTEYFCLILLNQPADNVFGFAIVVINVPYDTYRICITGPLDTETAECADLPLTAPDANGIRQAALVCKPGQGPGLYSVRWFVGGYQLGPPGYFESTKPAETQRCQKNP
jgi:hypothetical protein